LQLASGFRGRIAETLPDMIQVGERWLPLEFVPHARARRVALRLCPARRAVRLTMPPRTGTARAMAFAQSQQTWLEQQAARRLPPPAPFQPGGVILFRGADLKLTAGKGRSVLFAHGQLAVPGNADAFAGRVRRFLAAEARRLLTAETQMLAATVGRNDVQVRLGDPASRWGSCSASGHIAYSWRLVLAPDFVRQAVVAHEVAHLVEHHHGAAFWALATELLGTSHQPAKAWLSAHGPLLFAQGAVR